MMTRLFLLLLFAWQVQARVDGDISRSGSGSNFTNTASIGYSYDAYVSKNEVVGLNNYLQYSYSNSKSVINLNANLSDFEIVTNAHDLNYSISFYEKLTLAAGYSILDYNEKEAVSQQSSVGLYAQLGKLQLGFVLGSSQSKQLKEVNILNRDVKDQIKFNQKWAQYYLDYQFIDDLLIKLTGTYYSYDEDLNSAYTTLSSILLLDRAGPSMAYETQQQIKNSASLGMVYSLNENWLLEATMSRSQDYLVPEALTSGVEMNLTYENYFADDEASYKLYLGASSFRTEGVEGTESTLSGGLGFSY